MLFRTLQTDTLERRVKAEEAKADAAVAVVVADIVNADALDASRLAPLLTRDSYPRAVRALQNLTPQRWRDILARGLYHVSDNPFYITRIARLFEILPDARVIELEEVQALANSEPRARMALAAVGLIPWGEADRAERAIIALRALVRAWRA